MDSSKANGNNRASHRVGPLQAFEPVKGERQKAPEEERKTAWGCIYLCALFTFSSSVQFTLFMSSLWPFMQILDSTVTEGFFGLVIAMYSLSQIVASPILGIWSNRIEKLRPPLILCNVFMLVGNMMYFLVELFPAAHIRYVMMLSRLIAGIGWAQVGLLKAYASSASVVKDRSRATAFITGGVAMGLTLGPALQMVFTFIDYPGYRLCLFSTGLCVPNIRLSMFTAPPLFASVCNVALMFLLVFWFSESYVGVIERKNTKRETTPVDELAPALPPYDRWAVHVCYAMRFTQFFIFTNIETIGTAFAMMMFSWSPTDVVFYDSIAHCIRGAIALAVYLAYIMFDLGKKVPHRIACFVSLIALLLFHVSTFSWPFLPSTVHKFNGTNSSVGGCDEQRMDWCDGMTAVNVWVYYALMIVLIGAAFPNINVTMNTLFSHIIGPRIQSKQQGMLEMYGGMGRMLGPLLMGFLYSRYGPRAIWMLESAEIALMMALWLAFYSRLVPLKMAPLEGGGTGQNQRHLDLARDSVTSFSESIP